MPIIIIFNFSITHIPPSTTDNSYSWSHKFKKNYSMLIVTPPDLPEIQESEYRCKVMSNFGSDCYIFKHKNIANNKVYSFYISTLEKFFNYLINPDITIYLYPDMLYEVNEHIKYGVIDVSYISKLLAEKAKDEIADYQWMSYYDGFIVYGDNEGLFNNLSSEISRSGIPISNTYLLDYYPSIFATKYYKSNKNKLFYCGSNWDTKRGSGHYKKIFQLLELNNYFTVYGLKSSWEFMKNSYKGMIDFDPLKLIEKMQETGIALLLHSDYHLKSGVPSMRIFEAAAASNVIISDKHPFIMREFGECVFFIDPLQDPDKVVKDIDHIVNLVSSNSELANKRAKCAHDIFLKKFTLEYQLERVLKMHESVINNKLAIKN